MPPPTTAKKFFDSRHYYALAKEIRILREEDPTGDQFHSLINRLCGRFKRDNPEFNPKEWHERCSPERESREVCFTS